MPWLREALTGRQPCRGCTSPVFSPCSVRGEVQVLDGLLRSGIYELDRHRVLDGGKAFVGPSVPLGHVVEVAARARSVDVHLDQHASISHVQRMLKPSAMRTEHDVGLDVVPDLLFKAQQIVVLHADFDDGAVGKLLGFQRLQPLDKLILIPHLPLQHPDSQVVEVRARKKLGVAVELLRPFAGAARHEGEHYLLRICGFGDLAKRQVVQLQPSNEDVAVLADQGAVTAGSVLGAESDCRRRAEDPHRRLGEADSLAPKLLVHVPSRHGLLRPAEDHVPGRPEGALRIEIQQESLRLSDAPLQDVQRQEQVEEVFGVVKEVRKGVPLDEHHRMLDEDVAVAGVGSYAYVGLLKAAVDHLIVPSRKAGLLPLERVFGAVSPDEARLPRHIGLRVMLAGFVLRHDALDGGVVAVEAAKVHRHVLHQTQVVAVSAVGGLLQEEAIHLARRFLHLRLTEGLPGRSPALDQLRAEVLLTRVAEEGAQRRPVRLHGVAQVRRPKRLFIHEQQRVRLSQIFSQNLLWRLLQRRHYAPRIPGTRP
eukprot:scaffold69_cov248-Pinguiococcus_pyrenoidosus.AAC.83